jgi:hypothetical protein
MHYLLLLIVDAGLVWPYPPHPATAYGAAHSVSLAPFCCLSRFAALLARSCCSFFSLFAVLLSLFSRVRSFQCCLGILSRSVPLRSVPLLKTNLS